MACCVVLTKLPDIYTDDALRESSSASSTSSRSCRSKTRMSSQVSTSSSARAKPRSRCGVNASASRHVNVFKEPGIQQRPKRSCTSIDSQAKEAPKKNDSHDQTSRKSGSQKLVSPEVIVLSESDSENKTQLPVTRQKRKSRKSECESTNLKGKKLCNTHMKTVAKRKRASSLEWNWSGSESAGPSNVPQNKSRKMTRKAKRAPSIDSEWENDNVSIDSDDSDMEPDAESKVCHICDKKFRRPWLLRNHLHTHFDTIPLPFPCDEEGCTKAYTLKHHLERHKSISHSDLVVVSHVQCPAEGCGRIFSSGVGLKKHINSIHSGRSLKFPCPECDKQFRKHKQLRYHMAEHTGSPPLKCVECGAGAYSDNEMKRHMRTHKQYSCDVPGCDQKFSKYPLLRKHIAEHNRCFQSLSCAHCGKEFKTKSILRTHVMTHLENNRVFRCTYNSCQRFYYQERNLKSHIRIKHERKSKFVCSWPDCDMIFYSQRALTKHINVHENGKAPAVRRKQGPKAKRKDAGKPKRAMAIKLAGFNVPSDVEKKLLNADPACAPIYTELEKDSAMSASKAVPHKKRGKNALEQIVVPVAKIVLTDEVQKEKYLKESTIQGGKVLENYVKHVSEVIVEEKNDNNHVKGIESSDHTETEEVLSEKIVEEPTDENHGEGIESADYHETSLLFNESAQTILALTGKTFEVGEEGVLVEVECPSEAVDTSLNSSRNENMNHISSPHKRVPSSTVLSQVGEIGTVEDITSCEIALDEEHSAECTSNSVVQVVSVDIPKLLDNNVVQDKMNGIKSLPNQRSENANSNLTLNNSDEQGLGLNTPSTNAAGIKKINSKENNIKVYTDTPVANLMVGAEVDGLCATLYSETVVEGPPSHGGVEILLVIPSTGQRELVAEENCATDSVAQAVTETNSLFITTEGENCVTKPLSNSVSVNPMTTVCQEQLHKLATDEPYVASILEPLLQTFSKNEDMGGEKDSTDRSSVTSAAVDKTVLSIEYESVISILAGLIKSPFANDPINILKYTGRVTNKEHLRGPTQDTAESDGLSDSDSENASDFGSGDDEHLENNDEDDLVEDDANEDNGEAEDGEEEDGEDDDNDEDEHPEEGDDDDEEGDEDDDNNSDDEEDGNNNGINELNENNDNNDVSDSGNGNNNDSGRQKNQESTSNGNIGDGSEMGVDRQQSPKLKVQDDPERDGSFKSDVIDICSDNEEKHESLFLPASEDLKGKLNNTESEHSPKNETSPQINVSGPAGNESIKIQQHSKLVELDPENVVQQNSTGVFSERSDSVTEHVPKGPIKKNIQEIEGEKITKNMDSSKNAAHKNRMRKVNGYDSKSNKRNENKAKSSRKRKIDSWSSSNSEPLQEKRRRSKRHCNNISDDSNESDCKPEQVTDPMSVIDPLQKPVSPESTDGFPDNIDASIKNDLKVLKNIQADDNTPKACSKLPENTWISVLRQVTKNRNLSSVDVKD